MKRLIDERFAPGTPEDELVRLVRSSSRFEPHPFAKPRILARVMLPHPRRSGVLPRSIASFVVFGGTAMAAAAVGNHFLASHQRGAWVRDHSAAIELPVEPAVSPGVVASPATPVLEREPAPDLTVGSQVALSPHSAAAVSRGRSIASVVVRPPSNPKASVGAGVKAVRRPDNESEDPAQVLEAIRLLRARGNAWRASVLLDDYLKEHPRGILTEDALALAIEAADARHDRTAAAEYAERYIRQYPSGRYRPLADEALRR